ncbi:uncharacterized protein C8A04DRAFT_24544 [Dichotomopilus funicola]|uniref:Uncharacterized protein n=1 Tax=Dichotomopilus funicola TaxID=1934379 RepID=A0AAN6VC15_9PEZI|nr:hypothetical protein C8A04DRAFT_24544 [Dichotomopilus funicola]
MAAPPPPRVGNLKVVKEERQGRDFITVELPIHSTRYRIIEAFIHSSLCLLETTKGRQSLAHVAERIIEERNRLNLTLSRFRQHTHLYRYPLKDMPMWIDRFLISMRNTFPPVWVSTRCEGEAMAVKDDQDWGDDMSTFIASDAGTLWLNEVLIDNMTEAFSLATPVGRESYELFKFQLIISVAHEIVHFLTSFLTGSCEPSTPPGVEALPYKVDGVGEAGRYWEDVFLGGFLECWSDPKHPLDLRQPGRPYLFESGPRTTARGIKVCPTYIAEILSGRE